MHEQRMKRWRVLAVVAGCLSLMGCGESLTATTSLAGASEVPAVTSAATGTATATLEDSKLTLTGSFSGLESDLLEVAGSSAHVHRAAAGQNGPVVFNLVVTSADLRSGSFTGTQSLTEDQQRAFRAGELYVNVHTVNHSGGELRGQLVPQED